MSFVYLATPYSHPDPAVMEHRFDMACRAAAHLMRQGELVFSPIAHTHPIAVRGELPRGWEFWRQYDEVMIAAAGKLVVVRLDGWEQSRGVAGEIEIAQRLGVPVEHMEWPVRERDQLGRDLAKGVVR